jgi:hypothetical protein
VGVAVLGHGGVRLGDGVGGGDGCHFGCLFGGCCVDGVVYVGRCGCVSNRLYEWLCVS